VKFVDEKNENEPFEEIKSVRWEDFVRERYGAPPSVTYFESPVVVDNVTNEIVSD